MKVIRDRLGTIDVDDFLRRPLFAHLATASVDGPRDSPVWFLWEDDAIWVIGSRRTDTFPARVEREPRCALGIVDFDREEGLIHHVGMRGRATIEPFDPAEPPGCLHAISGNILSPGTVVFAPRSPIPTIS